MGQGFADRSGRAANDLRADAALHLRIDRDKIEAFCRRWGISELALFGSAARDELRPDSDVDVLVTFAQGARHGLSAMLDIQAELERLFGRKVDVLTRASVERSRNYIFRRQVLQNVQPLYVA